MSNDWTNSGEDMDQTRHRSRHRHRESEARMEDEIRAFLKDETRMAREIITIRKELGRLHFKVKSYQQANKVLRVMYGVTSLILLAIITYKVFQG
jgi:hypothetical protein